MSAQTGSVVGTVVDKETGELLTGATVVLKSTTKGTISDFDGNYLLQGIPLGKVTLICSFVSYDPLEKDIDIKNGENTPLNFDLISADVKLGEVEVVAKANRESENMLLLDQKNATIIKESIGAQQLSSMGVSDAASATTKISGVTKTEGNGDIYVRGLGDRYLSTTMNGLPIPSDDIDKKNINLNLFSTNVMSNIGISKAYSVANYGDLTSGNVDIVTKTLTNDKVLEIGIDGGINTSVMQEGIFDNFKATQNSNDISFLGYHTTPYELEESITKQSWNTTTKNLPADYGFSVMTGKKINLSGKDLYVLVTISQSSSSEYSIGSYRKYRMNNENNIFTDVENYKSNINSTGLVNLSYTINAYNSISYNLLYVHKIADGLYEEGRNKEGYIRDFEPNEQDGVFVRDQNTKETQIIINQIIGKHTLGEQNIFEWALGYNNVNADEPNRFRNEASFNPELDRWQFGHVSNFHVKKSMQEIQDNEINGYIKDEIGIVKQNNKYINLTVGANFRIKNRAFSSLYKGVEAMPSQINLASIDNMDEILLDTDLYADNNGLEIDNTLPADQFDARLTIFAGIVDLSFKLKKLSGSLGVRYELDQLEANWDVGNYVGRTGERSTPYDPVLPAINLKYQIAEKSALRFAASKTITLPEFKEISPFEYVSPEGNVIKGNEDLKNSVNYNLDVKWEIYPKVKELFSVTGFYKLINDPINLALSRGSSGYFKFDNTGDKATVYGLEFETRYGIINSNQTNKPGINLVFNATKMWFSQDLLKNFQYNNITKTGLEGASELIVNGALSYSNNKVNKLEATLTANYSSDKIYALGAPESQTSSATLYNSEIIEKGFTTIDLIVSKKISKRIAIKLKAKNLLDPQIEQTQYIDHNNETPQNEVVRSYKRGIDIGLGIKINLN